MEGTLYYDIRFSVRLGEKEYISKRLELVSEFCDLKDFNDKIQKLIALKDCGLLSDKEFEANRIDVIKECCDLDVSDINEYRKNVQKLSFLQIGEVITEEEYEKIMEYAEDENWESALELAAEAIIDELTGWRLVEIEEVMQRHYSPKEYEVVAMRFCSYDFHFWKLGCNWNWYDKAGGSNRIGRHAFKDVVRKNWNHRYDSPIICFVRMH